MKKSYSINIPADFFWKVIVPSLVLAVIIGGGLGIIIIDKIIMPGIVHTGRQIVEVPQITNKDWEAARQDLFDVGLRLQISEKKYQENMPDGFVISQLPAAGEKVKKGRMVLVSVSKGSEVGVVPVVRGLTERKATIELRKLGFIIGKRKRDYNDTLEKDNIVSISPVAGTMVSREMPLDIIISDGPKPTHATVPNLVGESLVDAKQKIEASGLVLGTLDDKNNTAVAPGTVLSQSVPPGSSLPLQSKINIIVSVAK